MAESPVDKTTRKLIAALEEHQFTHQATVHLNGETAEVNLESIKRVKRLIKEENPELTIFYFMSLNTDKDGVDNLYITFYSNENLLGTRVMKEANKPDSAIAVDGVENRRKYISRNLRDNYIAGFVKRLKKEKVHDISYLPLPQRFKRIGYLNKTQKTLN